MSESQRLGRRRRLLHHPSGPGGRGTRAAALRDSEAAGLPAIDVDGEPGQAPAAPGPDPGRPHILEIGTLGGYSTIWLARALPADGRLVSLEYEPGTPRSPTATSPAPASTSIVEVRVGPALESLPQLADENPAPFDLVFIDADKANNPHYLEWALKLTSAGSLIVVDNVVRGGRVADPAAPPRTSRAPAPRSN